jgi:CO dehydrogenase maturation factor
MAQKAFTIVVAGKGGTGKTLVSALLVRDQRRHGPVLAIDADPDANLPELLGVEVEKTIGDIRESLLEHQTRHTDGETVPIDKRFEQGVMEAIVEEDDFDLLVMGRSEGEGCYCAVNHILRRIIDTQVQNYPTVVIDSEAGLEHISRRTARDVDLMLMVTDTSARGVNTARRVSELGKELRVDFGKVMMLVNKATDETRPIITEHAETAGLDLLGFLPFDPAVLENDAQGKSIWELPEDGPVMRTAAELFPRLDRIRREGTYKTGSTR